ncbi:MAG TPA: biotin/lipoyl-binding protein, partial [Ignavibacteria bacterium]|nr:biotin/lipoyl-binding protein [Ignavibacteria bacterium]
MTNGKSKKSKKKLIIFGGLGILVIALVLIAIFGSNNEKIIQVQTEKVNKRNITQTVTGTGNLDPKHKVIITPQITGEIVELPVKEGDYFHKGVLLIKIKQDYYIAQRDQAQANLEVAQANLSMKQANLEKLTANFKRVRKLHEKKLTSDSNLEAARSSYLSAKAAYEGGMAQVSTARAALNQQVDQLSKTVIHSPMNGTVTKLNVELGERVL